MLSCRQLQKNADDTCGSKFKIGPKEHATPKGVRTLELS